MLEFLLTNGKLEIRRGGKLIYIFVEGGFFAEVGAADTTFAMNRGSFKIKEAVLDRQPLFIKQIALQDDTAILTLSEGRVKRSLSTRAGSGSAATRRAFPSITANTPA